MADMSSGLGWSDAQWEKVNDAVTEAFSKASVASAVLPCYGPLGGSASRVKSEVLDLLTAALEKHKVAPRERSEFLEIIQGMQGLIVEYSGTT